MADDGRDPTFDDYAPPSRSDNKRKFEGSDQEKRTGLSGPPAENRASYNSVPPPLSDFELAKQRAEQIAARLAAQDTKRSRVEENEDEPATKFSSHGPNLDQRSYPDHEHGQKFQELGHVQQPVEFHDSQQESYYNIQGHPESRKVEIPNSKVGLIIGKGGETIKYLQQQSGARIQITRDSDHDRNAPTRHVELMGTAEQINCADQLIKDVIAEADAGGSGALVARGFGGLSAPGDQIQIRVPNNKVGLIIGRGGETIKYLQSRSGARIQLVPLQAPGGGESECGVIERVVTLLGNRQQTNAASELIKEVINETVDILPPADSGESLASFSIGLWTSGANTFFRFWGLIGPFFGKIQYSRFRGPPTSGGYHQQGFRPSVPPGPQQWVPPGATPMQQQGYNYQQQRYYSGPPQQYPGPTQQYGAYEQQQPSTGHTSGWDQRPPVPSQQAQQPGAYDYYNQQGQAGNTPTECQYGYAQPQSGGYSQQAAYGQQSHGPQVSAQQSYGQQAYGQTYGQQQAYEQGRSGPQTYSHSVSTQPSYSQQIHVQQVVAQTSHEQQGPNPQSYGQQGSNQPGYGQLGSGQQGYLQETPAQPSYAQAVGPQPGYRQSGSAQPGHGQQGTALPGYSGQLVSNPPGYGQQGITPPSHGTQSGSLPSGTVQQEAPQVGYGQQGSAQPGSGQQGSAPSGYGQHGLQQVYGQTAATQQGYPQHGTMVSYRQQVSVQTGYGESAYGYEQPQQNPGGSIQQVFTQQPQYLSPSNGAENAGNGGFESALNVPAV